MSQEHVVVIPARMASSRFPGKPLTPILGRPMLEHCVDNAVAAVGSENTFIASCDEEILDFARTVGVTGIVTSASHDRATDRVAEALEQLNRAEVFPELVVLLQGDEPLIKASSLAEIVDFMESQTEVDLTNLVGPITSSDDFINPNTIKVVADYDGKARYFSRAPIPYGKFSRDLALRQVCAFGFRAKALLEFSKLAETPLEEAESIDMLRWIQHGNQIGVIPVGYETHPVDVPSDVRAVEDLILRT